MPNDDIKQKPGAPASIRTWLRFATTEGAFANVFITFTGGAFVAGLALMLGANDFQIGFLAAIPFLSQIAQLASTFFVDRFHNRKTAVLILSAIGRQIWWLVGLVLILHVDRGLEILMAVMLISNVGVMAATPSWMAWMADIVPERLRGRYFGLRSAVLAVITVVAALVGGVILDYAAHHEREYLGFVVIIVISCLCAGIALFILSRIPDPSRYDRPVRFIWSELWKPLMDRPFRRLLLVFFGWNISIGIAAPFFAPHMLTNLGMSFTLISLYSGFSAITAIVFTRPWGALIDRFGSKPVSAICAFGIGFVPLIWLFPRADLLWVLIPEAIYSGALWAGFNLAAFTIPIANSPRENRSNYIAVFNVATGLAFFAASVLGGALAEMWHDISWLIGPQHIVNYHVLFVISSLLRLAAAALILTFHEAHEKSVPIVVHFMGYAILKRLSTGRQLLHWPPRRENTHKHIV